jgi:FkbM family methyltransferase
LVRGGPLEVSKQPRRRVALSEQLDVQFPAMNLTPKQVTRRLRETAAIRQPFIYGWRELVVRTDETNIYGIRGTSLRVALRHRTSDASNVHEVFVRRAFALPEAVKQILPTDRPLHAVDLGAYIGLFGIWLIDNYPDAHIVAVEPDPGNRATLERTVALNGRDDTWQVIGACAGTTSGTVKFQAMGSMDSKVGDGAPTPLVDVFPLMDGSDLVKIDVEGAEWPILSDPRLAEAPRAMFLEYHPPLQQAAVHEALANAGYRVMSEMARPRATELWAIRS